MDSKPETGNAVDGGVGVLNHHIQSCSQLSGLSITSESSAPNFVYQRKRIQKNPNPVFPTLSPDNIAYVYERRKHQKSAPTNFTLMVSENSSPIKRGLNEREGTRVSSIEQPLTTSEAIDGYVTEDRGFDAKEKRNKGFDLYSIDDSCSSSLLNVDSGSSPLKSKVDETDECSSSGALVVDVMGNDKSLSVKGLCVSILRSHGLLSNYESNRSGLSEEDAPSCSGSSCSRTCNVCGVVGTAIDLLICDECEKAFHISCFNPCIKKIPDDDWYCQPCSKKKHNLLKERAIRRSSIIRTGKGSVSSEGDFSPIALMLNDSQPYITGVRVGKGFQAFVPEWCGPVARRGTVFPEPMELDPLQPVHLLGPTSGKHRKAFIGNWLQCRDVIVGMGDSIDGTICGKWRRAPLFEIQTDKWDCFRSVLWDPSHADCSVPQELETEEVLKQLKYIEMLRPRLAAKRRKFDVCTANGSEAVTEDVSKCTGSVDAERNL
ncbi:hypothetical protein SOVF_033790 [Spinacia oleracea]|nr:uncharacterized protein LOC110799488 isoform X2 [Spinacia oleracea]XP_056692373.1 uncharacterized protein LOC110799488 isoform X2 [Spinacia oleracea]KNA22432.1 hypothetical protein SOVF_033790 [Spinacia oleracea]